MKSFKEYISEMIWRIPYMHHDDDDIKTSINDRYKHMSDLPSGHKLFMSRNMDGLRTLKVVHPKTKKTLMNITADKYRKHFHIHTVYKPAGGPRNLKYHHVLHHLIIHHGFIIHSDNRQTEQATKAWEKLSEMPGVQVRHYNSLHRKYLKGPVPVIDKIPEYEADDLLFGKGDDHIFVARRRLKENIRNGHF